MGKYLREDNFPVAVDKGSGSRGGGGGGGEEEFFNHYKNDLERHAHTPIHIKRSKFNKQLWQNYRVEVAIGSISDRRSPTLRKNRYCGCSDHLSRVLATCVPRCSGDGASFSYCSLR